MRSKIYQQGILFVAFLCLALVFLFTGCDTEITGSDPETAVNSQEIDAEINAAVKKFSIEYKYYTPRGSVIGIYGSPNCHSFAWQNNKMPTSAPSYGISSPAVFWNDGSFYNVTGQTIKVGDRTVYDAGWHSAVVCYVEKNGNVLVNSYLGGVIEYSVPASKFGTPTYYRISDDRYWSIPNPRCKVSLWSVYKRAYVCADFWDNTPCERWNPNAPLYANRPEVQEWETFYFVDAGSGYVSLFSQGSLKYVIASQNTRATANAGYPGSWAKFKLETVSGYTCLKCYNGYYLHNESFIAGNRWPMTGSYFNIAKLN